MLRGRAFALGICLDVTCRGQCPGKLGICYSLGLPEVTRHSKLGIAYSAVALKFGGGEKASIRLLIEAPAPLYDGYKLWRHLPRPNFLVLFVPDQQLPSLPSNPPPPKKGWCFSHQKPNLSSPQQLFCVTFRCVIDGGEESCGFIDGPVGILAFCTAWFSEASKRRPALVFDLSSDPGRASPSATELIRQTSFIANLLQTSAAASAPFPPHRAVLISKYHRLPQSPQDCGL